MYKAAPPFGIYDNREDALKELKRQMAVLEEMADAEGGYVCVCVYWGKCVCLCVCTHMQIATHTHTHARAHPTPPLPSINNNRPLPHGQGEVDGGRHALLHGRVFGADPAQPLWVDLPGGVWCVGKQKEKGAMAWVK